MTSLTPQQINHLDTLDHDTLLEIIRDITRDNVPAYNVLVNHWLSAADEVLDRLAHEYNALATGHDYYRYYESCDLYLALLHDIAYPLEKQVERLPAGVEHLAAKWLLDFDRLMEISDSPRDDVDETYFSSLLASWFQALTLQPMRSPKETAQAIFQVAQGCERFTIRLLSEWRDALGDDVLHALAHQFKDAGALDKAISLYLILRDIDESLALIQQQTRPNVENGVQLAHLLLEASRRQEAIAILRLIEPYIHAWLADFKHWAEMLITSLTAENECEQARAVALNAFSYLACGLFWRLYLQAGGDEVLDFPLFLARLRGSGSEDACQFLSECGRYDLLDQIVRATATADVPVSLPVEFHDGLWRRLSTELYQQGYEQAAITLCCHRAEWAMEHGGRECYEAAAVDVSAAFSYCSAPNLPELSSWLLAMYAKYRRKYTLWKIMRENVPGLSISKGIGPVWQQ